MPQFGQHGGHALGRSRFHVIRCHFRKKSADPDRRAQSSSSYVESKICHKIKNPKSKIPKLQNPKSPKSKIQNPQNPKSPKSKIQNPPNLGRWGPHIKICYITVQNPKSKIPKIQNPQDPKSKIRNPQFQNPKSPKSKIQNPKSPKPKIPEIWGHIKMCYITVQNPKSKIPKIGQKSLDFGLGDLGFWISAPKSKIQNPQDPKSKIPKIQNPQNPKSKIPKIQNLPPKSKIWGVGGLT